MAGSSTAASSSTSFSSSSSSALLLLLLLLISTMMAIVQSQYHPGLVSTQLLYQPISGAGRLLGGSGYGYGYGYGSGGYNAGGGGTRHGQGFVGNPGIGITQSSATLANVYTPRMAAMGLLPAVSNLYGGSPQPSQYGSPSTMMLMPPTTPMYPASLYSPQPSLQYAGYPGVATSTSYFHRYMAKR